jgi:hypothetical protein
MEHCQFLQGRRGWLTGTLQHLSTHCSISLSRINISPLSKMKSGATMNCASISSRRDFAYRSGFAQKLRAMEESTQ